MWVFIKATDGYQLLLDTRNKEGYGGVELLTVEEARTKGFRDIVLAAHDSASEKTLLCIATEMVFTEKVAVTTRIGCRGLERCIFSSSRS